VFTLLPLLTACTLAVAESRLERTLALAPSRTIAFIAIPNPKAASDDLQQCLARMERAETAALGRPIDQLTARFGISASFDDKGPMLLAMLPPAAEGGDAIPLVFIPSSDPANFLGANLKPSPDDGADAFRTPEGMLLFGKPLAAHAVVSTDAATVRGYEPDAGLAAPFASAVSPRAVEIATRGDVVAWAGPTAISDAMRRGAAMAPPDLALGDRELVMQERSRELFAGLGSGLVAIDFDPLGVGIRAWSKATDGTELATLLAGGGPGEAKLDRLANAPFYLAAAFDLAGVGGFARVEEMLAKSPEAAAFPMPAWLANAAREVNSVQIAIYPSKLGIVAGGILNDAALYFRTGNAAAVKDALKQAILATAGTAGGVRREPTWTDAKTLKDGTVADVYEVKETVLPPEQAGDTRAGDVAIQRLVTQAIYGSGGFRGFVKETSGGVVMTFSQRVDVLNRALGASAGGKTLAADATLASYSDWLVPQADAVGFIGLGQFGKLIKQVAGMVPGGGVDAAALPDIPVSTEPVAFAFAIDRGEFESALVLPATALALAYDQIVRSLSEAAPPALGGEAANP
jgi:hypothetical protein